MFTFLLIIKSNDFIVSSNHLESNISNVSDGGCRYERTQAEYVEKLPPGKHSCKGVGATVPDPDEKHILDDGVEIPYGKPTSKPQQQRHTSLLYNEYPLLAVVF